VCGRTVLALTVYDGKIVVGGNFRMAAGANDIDHIFSWDGLKVNRIGRGLDGVVDALAVHEGLLVVGGQFTIAWNSDGSLLRSGGLVGWNGLSWFLLGDSMVQGMVTALLAVSGKGQSKLYIAGRFGEIGSLRANGIAVFEGNRWMTIGQDSGFSGGHINAMVVFDSHLYIGGTFSRIGNVSAAGFARWDGHRYIRSHLCAPSTSVIHGSKGST
jgi:hypothetical protein